MYVVAAAGSLAIAVPDNPRRAVRSGGHGRRPIVGRRIRDRHRLGPTAVAQVLQADLGVAAGHGLPYHVDRAIDGTGNVRLDVGQRIVGQAMLLAPLVVFPRHGVDVPIPGAVFGRPLGVDQPRLVRSIDRDLRTPEIFGGATDRNQPRPAAFVIAPEVQLLAPIVIAVPSGVEIAGRVSRDGRRVVLAQLGAGQVRGGRGALDSDPASERPSPRAELHRHRLEGEFALGGLHAYRSRAGAAAADPHPLGQNFLAGARRGPGHYRGLQQDPHGLRLQPPSPLGQNPIRRLLAVRHERQDLAALDRQVAVPFLASGIADAEQDQHLPHVRLAGAARVPGEMVEEIRRSGGRRTRLGGRRRLRRERHA